LLLLFFSLFLTQGAAFFDFSFTNYSVMAFLLFLILFAFINVLGLYYIVNSLFQYVMVTFINLHAGMVKEQLGAAGKTFLPFLLGYMFLIFLANLAGTVPYGMTLTAHLAVTFFLGFSIFASINITGMVLHKHHFLSLFFPSGTPLVLAPLIVPIELMSYIFRVITLSVRLFANMMAGHALVKVIAGFGWSMVNSSGIVFFAAVFPLALVTILVGFEIAVAFIQGYVFLVLASMYSHDAILLH